MSIAFNFERVGNPIAKIKTNDSNNHKLLSITNNEEEYDEVSKPYEEYKLPKGKFHLLPPKQGRNIIYITGPSGSGKSYFTKQYITEYKQIHKNRPIFLFSHLDDDDTLANVDLYRLKIDETLINDPINIEEFTNSLVIFDDIDTISNKKIKEAVYNIANQILQIGRHFCISSIFTSHLPTMGNWTKIILCESAYVVYFPSSTNGRGLNYLLEQYLGLDKKIIKEIKESRSRWACIHNRYPNFYLTENKVKLI